MENCTGSFCGRYSSRCNYALSRRNSARQIAYTERVAKKSCTLPNGSNVVLNAESKLIYSKTFNDKQRRSL